MPLFRPILESAIDRLRAHEELHGIPIHADGIGKTAAEDIETLVQWSLDQAGTSIEVAIPGANPEAIDAPGPYFGEIPVVVRIIQKIETSLAEEGPGHPILDLVEFVCESRRGLHHYRATDLDNRVFVLSEDGWDRVADPRGELRIVDINFTITGGLSVTAS